MSDLPIPAPVSPGWAPTYPRTRGGLPGPRFARPTTTAMVDLSMFNSTSAYPTILNAVWQFATNERRINDIIPMVTIEEDHDDDLVITEHPVEYGAAITDHSYKRPCEVRIRVGWSQSPGVSHRGPYRIEDVRFVYERLLSLQNARNPFTLLTGKRTYINMLVAGIRVHTDARFEYSFIADISLKEILLVTTQTLPGSSNSQNLASPQAHSQTQQTGTMQLTTTTMTATGWQEQGGMLPPQSPFLY